MGGLGVRACRKRVAVLMAAGLLATYVCRTADGGLPDKGGARAPGKVIDIAVLLSSNYLPRHEPALREDFESDPVRLTFGQTSNSPDGTIRVEPVQRCDTVRLSREHSWDGGVSLEVGGAGACAILPFSPVEGKTFTIYFHAFGGPGPLNSVMTSAVGFAGGRAQRREGPVFDVHLLGNGWERRVHVARFSEHVDRLHVRFHNVTGRSVNVDNVCVYAGPYQAIEAVTDAVVAALEALGIPFRTVWAGQDKAESVRGCDALLVPAYVEDEMAPYLLAAEGTRVFIVSGLPGVHPSAWPKDCRFWELRTGQGKGGTFLGPAAPVKIAESDGVVPLVVCAANPGQAVAWRTGNVWTNTFDPAEAPVWWTIGQMVRELDIPVLPFVYALDVDDLNDEQVSGGVVERMTQYFSERRWCTVVGIKPECIGGGKVADGTAQGVILREVRDHPDLYAPITHSHAWGKWTSGSKEMDVLPTGGCWRPLKRPGW